METVHDDVSTSVENLRDNSIMCEDDPDFHFESSIIPTSALKSAINTIRQAFIMENPKALLTLHPVMDELYELIKKRDKQSKIDDFFIKK